MFINTVQMPFEAKRDEVFMALEELKNCNLKVKAYYYWLKAKNTLSSLDIDKAYNMITSSIAEVQKEEMDRKIWIFRKNTLIAERIRKEEQNEISDTEIEEIM